MHAIFYSVFACYVFTIPIFHDYRKHIKVDFSFDHERVSCGDLVVHYIPTQLQLTVIFATSPPINRFLFFKTQSFL